jgi:tRNA-dihydrouridine synthase
MNIYEQIDKLFYEEKDDIPVWANNLITEIKNLKEILNNQKTVEVVAPLVQQKPQISREFYSFIKKLRNKMKADTYNNIYPEIIYKNKAYGINFKGLLYDKENLRIISKDEAYYIYKYVYNESKNIV